MHTFRFFCFMFLFVFLFAGCEQHEANKIITKSFSFTAVAGVIPEGWEVLEDVNSTSTLDVAKLHFKPFRTWINDDEKRKRVVDHLNCNLGILDAKHVFDDQTKFNPSAACTVFTGTKLRARNGLTFFPCLYVNSGHLIFEFHLIDHFDYTDVACSE